MPNQINHPYDMFRRFTYFLHLVGAFGGIILIGRGMVFGQLLIGLGGLVILAAAIALRHYGMRHLNYRHIENGLDYREGPTVNIDGEATSLDDLVFRLINEDLDPWERQKLRHTLQEVFRQRPELYPQFAKLLESRANFVPPAEAAHQTA